MTSQDRFARELALEFEKLKKAVRNGTSTPQLGSSAIHDGAIEDYDGDDVYRGQVGTLPDGTHGSLDVNGPTPPTPTAPVAVLAGTGALIRWDGGWIDGLVAPLDFARIDVHITAPGGTALSVPASATLSGTTWGGATVSLGEGEYQAHLVAWTKSGKFTVSAASATFEVQSVGGGSDGNPPAVAPDFELSGGVGAMWVKASAIENPDPFDIVVYARISGTSTFFDVGRLQNGGGGAIRTINDVDLEGGDSVDVYLVPVEVPDGEGPASTVKTATVKSVDFDQVSDDLRDAIFAAADDAELALTTANGKNGNSSSTTPSPSTTGRAPGDLHYVLGTGDQAGTYTRIQRLSAGPSFAWVDMPADVATLAGADVGWLNAIIASVDTLLARLVAADEVTADMVGTDFLDAERARIIELIVERVVAGFVLTGSLQVGAKGGAGFDLDDVAGFVQRGFFGTPRVTFPMDPNQPNVLRSDVIAEGLTTLGRASFRGTENEVSRGSAFTLEVGTTRPSSALGGSAGGTWSPVANMKIPEEAVGGFLDTDGSWIFAAMPTSSAGKPRLIRLASDGTITRETITGLPAPTSANNYYVDVGGIVRVGARYFLSATRRTSAPDLIGARDLDNRVYTLTTSLASNTNSWSVHTGSDYLNRISDSIATDGTDVFVHGFYDDVARFRRFNVSGDLQASTAFTSPGGSGFASSAGPQFTVGNHDFGSTRYILGKGGSFYSFAGGGTAVSAENFQAGITTYRWGWNGTRFMAWDSAGNAYLSDTRKENVELRAGYTWYDSDTAGSTHETQIGPIRTIVLPARSGAYRLTAPPPADDGTQDAPDSSRLYVGRTDGTLRLQGTFLGEITVSNPNLDSGAAPPTTNSFPDGVPAVMRSKSGATAMYGDSKMLVRTPLAGNEAANKDYVDGPAMSKPTGFTSGTVDRTANPVGYRYYQGRLELTGSVGTNSVATNATVTLFTIAAPGVEKVVGAVGGAGYRPGRVIIGADGVVQWQNGQVAASTLVYFDGLSIKL